MAKHNYRADDMQNYIHELEEKLAKIQKALNRYHLREKSIYETVSRIQEILKGDKRE